MPEPQLAQFTTVFRATEPRRPRRGRQALSCTACQKRKSRCDRRQPCGACEKRGDADSCKFGPSVSAESNRGRRQEMQSRLTKLEEMVKGLADESTRLSSSSPPGPAGAGAGAVSRDDLSAALQRSDIRDSEETTQNGKQPDVAAASQGGYHGPTAWEALVHKIHDIKSILEIDQDSWDDEGQNEFEVQPPVENDVVFGDTEPVTHNEILDILPSRQDTDRIITAYFNAKFIAVPFLHTHQFRRKYDAFWENPSSADILWVSILLSILSVGTMILRIKGTSVTSTSDAVLNSRAYQAMAARCLVTGRYLKAKPLSVEAVIMYAHSRNIQKVDADPVVWHLYGIAIRLAQRRGYHRDPEKAMFKMTPFETEMRRRVWFLARSYDLLSSYQQGMPNMVHEDGSDTKHPSNMTDDDFDEDSTELIPRPQTDPLPITAYIQKSKAIPVLRRVMAHALDIKPLSFIEAKSLGDELHGWYNSIPPCLRYRSLRETSFTDPNYTAMHRIMLELIYRISICNLYRPFLVKVVVPGQEAVAREALEICRGPALRMIEIHIEIDREIQPGGRLHEDRYMVSSLTLHDFLVAAMVICLELTLFTGLAPEETTHRTNVLRSSYRMWLARSRDSMDALHASKVLRAILDRIEATSPPTSGLNSSSTGDTPMTQQSNEMGSEFEINQNTFTSMLNFDELPSLESFFTNNEGLDWSSLDRYLRHETSMEVGLDLPFLDLGIGKSGLE